MMNTVKHLTIIFPSKVFHISSLLFNQLILSLKMSHIHLNNSIIILLLGSDWLCRALVRLFSDLCM